MVLTLVSVTVCAFLEAQGWAPRIIRYVPEIMALFAAAIVVVVGTGQRFRNVAASYWIVFACLAMALAFSAIINAVEPGPLFSGLRNYLRALPFFFLPAVVFFDERETRTQLLVVLALAVLQLPIALYQRLTTFSDGVLSGDRTTGTLMDSSMLSIFLICVACVLTAFYIRKRLGITVFLPLLLLVLLPTSLNETTGTVLLLPLGLVATFVFAEIGAKRVLSVIKAALLLSIFASIFIPIYDYYMLPRTGEGIIEFMTDARDVERYVSKDADIGNTERLGRGDAITIPTRVLRSDPVQFVFGLGPGNVGDSGLGEDFTGRYFATLGPFLRTLWTIVTLELGMLGFGLLLVLMWLVFRDARILAGIDHGLIGTLALGWLGVMFVMMASFFYKPMIPNETASYLFWYFSGLIAAERMKLAVTERDDLTFHRGRSIGSEALALKHSVADGWRVR